MQWGHPSAAWAPCAQQAMTELVPKGHVVTVRSESPTSDTQARKGECCKA